MAKTAAAAGTAQSRTEDRGAGTVAGPGDMVWMTQRAQKNSMTQPIVYVDTSKVRPGRLAELKVAMTDLARFVQANEPRLLAYNVYFSDNRYRMSVLHINLNSASLRAAHEGCRTEVPTDRRVHQTALHRCLRPTG